jgi:hypothetical protein
VGSRRAPPHARTARRPRKRLPARLSRAQTPGRRPRSPADFATAPQRAPG